MFKVHLQQSHNQKHSWPLKHGWHEWHNQPLNPLNQVET
jgi:hypothetical protein